MDSSFFESNLFSYVVLPLMIFCARICDVSIGTLRIIFVSKGKRNIAPLLGFFEVLIWIIVVSRVMQNLDNYLTYIAYAAGFATGNYVGMILEERLAVGVQLIRVITHREGPELVRLLSAGGFGATIVDARGARENVALIYTIVPRNDLDKVLDIINNFNPKAFYSIEDVRATSEGIFPAEKLGTGFPFINIIRRWRGGK
jgi:uncharacterized protein YebE (UPF0316 family)